MDVGCALRGNHPAAAAAPLHRGDRGLVEGTGLGKLGAARNDGAPERRAQVRSAGIHVPETHVLTLVLIPSVEGCRSQAAGWFPALYADATLVHRPGAMRRDRAGLRPARGAPSAHRHCEAPVSPRYVGRYRCEAIQCRGDNIRYVSQNCTSTLDCFAAFQ
ncbi:MAG: hypothetical protein LBM98_08290 [Oscillospiraceae bacterium]|nr:hypothetical protein [Oscillospiraceae bacterium]